MDALPAEILAPAAVPSAIPPTPAGLYDAVMLGRTAATARAYRQDLEEFARYLALPGPAEALAELAGWSQGTATHCTLRYRDYLAARGLSPATVARRLSALRTAVRLGRQLGVIPWTLEVEGPRIRAYRDTSGPGADGWAALLAEARGRSASPGGRRDAALLLLLHDLGLRRAEAAGLDRAHVELDRSRIWVLGKGRAQREAISIPGRVRAALAAWMADLPAGAPAVFVRLDGQGRPTADRITGDGVAYVVGRLGERANLGRRARPHGLRHQAITEALEKTGGDVARVQRFARHAKVETTLRYNDSRADDAGAIAGLLAGE